MNFLRQHFEKLILGIVLAALVAAIVLVLLSIGKGKSSVGEEKETAESVLKMGKELAPDQSRDLAKATEVLISPKNHFDFVPPADDPKGSLVEPVHYLRCVNPRCPYLIPNDERVCRFCGTEEPPEKKDVYPVEEDQDRDGIPNYVEKNTPFLKFDDPADAGQDYDQDTFTNLEEFRNGTNMALATSFPPLALNLRLYEKPSNPLFPMQLRSIQASNPDDPKTWGLSFSIYNPQTRRPFVRTLHVGETMPFRVSDGRRVYGPLVVESAVRERRQVGDETKDVGIVTMTWDDKKYTFVEGEKAYDPTPTTDLIYLASRYKKYEENLKRQYRIRNQEGEFFQLLHLPTQRREVYKVISIADDKVVVELVQGGAGAGADGMMGGMPGGGMGDPGMMGGGGGMDMGMGMPGMPGGAPGMATPGGPGTGKEPEPVRFEITRQFDAGQDLMEMPRVTRQTPGSMLPGTLR